MDLFEDPDIVHVKHVQPRTAERAEKITCLLIIQVAYDRDDPKESITISLGILEGIEMEAEAIYDSIKKYDMSVILVKY